MTSVWLIGVPVELEVGDVLGKREVGNGELVIDRPGLLLVDLGGEQIADDGWAHCRMHSGTNPTPPTYNTPLSTAPTALL